MRFSALRATMRLIAFAALVAGLSAPYAVMLVLRPRKRHDIARLFYQGCLRLTGVRLSVTGWPAHGVAIFTANHASYLDIPVLGAVLSSSVFVAKSEVSGWPVFGLLARLARTEFITRTPAHAPAQSRQLARRINRGDSLILFPEGTSSNGATVRPFKSALFSSLDTVAREAWVQPVTIAYARTLHGARLPQPSRDLYAWYGDMTLAPHLVSMFGLDGCEVEITFHAPVRADGFESRKALARYCGAKVAEGLADTIDDDIAEMDAPAYPNVQDGLEPAVHAAE